jgi:hypothetical protein
MREDTEDFDATTQLRVILRRVTDVVDDCSMFLDRADSHPKVKGRHS